MTTPEQDPSDPGLQAQPGTLAEWLTAQLDREYWQFVGAPDFDEADTSVRGPGWGSRECALCDHVTFDGSEAVTEEAILSHMDFMHDREFRLADIAAKRCILAEYVAVAADPVTRVMTIHAVLLQVLRLLAQPYRDQPGFDPAWVIS